MEPPPQDQARVRAIKTWYLSPAGPDLEISSYEWELGEESESQSSQPLLPGIDLLQNGVGWDEKCRQAAPSREIL